MSLAQSKVNTTMSNYSIIHLHLINLFLHSVPTPTTLRSGIASLVCPRSRCCSSARLCACAHAHRLTQQHCLARLPTLTLLLIRPFVCVCPRPPPYAAALPRSFAHAHAAAHPPVCVRVPTPTALRSGIVSHAYHFVPAPIYPLFPLFYQFMSSNDRFCRVLSFRSLFRRVTLTHNAFFEQLVLCSLRPNVSFCC
jgi:hypothetical protein